MERSTKDYLNAIERKISIATKEVLTFDETALYTGLSESYLYKLTSGSEIPHYKPRNKLLYFKRSEVEMWLLQNRVKTNKEIEQEASTMLVKGLVSKRGK